MFAIPNANKPEKAPAIALAVKKIAMRVWLSPGRYHLEMRRMAPGKKPALFNRISMDSSIQPKARTHSNNPSSTRTPQSSWKFLTNPWQVITMPQAVTIAPMNKDGRSNRLRIALLGTSANRVSQNSPRSLRATTNGRTGQCVRNEEDGKSDVVLGTTHVQIRQEALDFGIPYGRSVSRISQASERAMHTDICAVNERDEVKHKEHRDESPIDLANHRFPLIFRKVREESDFFRAHVAIVDLLGVDDLVLFQVNFIVATRADISVLPLRHCVLQESVWRVLDWNDKGSGQSPAR
jgi:hypothetical protein